MASRQTNKEFEHKLVRKEEQLQSRIDAELDEYRKKIEADREAHVTNLVSRFEHKEHDLRKKLAQEEKEMKAEREAELKRISAERKERMRSIKAERQREEEQIETEKRRLDREISQKRSDKEKEFQALNMWKKRELEKKMQDAAQTLSEQKRIREEDIAHNKEIEEEIIATNADWRKFVADKTGNVITSTTDMKVRAIGRLEERRMKSLISSDMKRTELYIALHTMSDSEENVACLDSILPERSLYHAHGATAIAQIEAQATKLSLTAAESTTAPTCTSANSELSHCHQHSRSITRTLRSIADKLKRKKREVNEKGAGIVQATSAKIKKIEESECKRFDRVDATDSKAVTLLHKIASHGAFQPEVMASLSNELSPQSAFRSQATEDIANIELKPD